MWGRKTGLIRNQKSSSEEWVILKSSSSSVAVTVPVGGGSVLLDGVVVILELAVVVLTSAGWMFLTWDMKNNSLLKYFEASEAVEDWPDHDVRVVTAGAEHKEEASHHQHQGRPHLGDWKYFSNELFFIAHNPQVCLFYLFTWFWISDIQNMKWTSREITR